MSHWTQRNTDKQHLGYWISSTQHHMDDCVSWRRWYQPETFAACHNFLSLCNFLSASAEKKPKSLKQSTDREVLRYIWWRKAVLILFCFTSKLKDYIWYLQTDSEIKILIFMCIFSSVAALTAVIVSAHITQEPSWVRLPDIRYRNRLVQQIICLPWAGPLWSLQAPL